MLLTLGRGHNHASTIINSTLQNFSIPSADLTPKSIALLGDSISAHNTSSDNTEYLSQGYINLLNAITGQRYHFPPANNLGVGGFNILQINNKKTDIATLVEQPDIIFVLGGTNNIAASTTQEDIILNLSQIYDYIVNDLGKKVVALTIPPRTVNPSGNSLSTANLTKLKNINNWIMGQTGNITPIDIFTPLSINDGQPNPEYFAKEGDFGTTYVHPNPKGALIIATSIQNVLNTIYGAFEIPDMSQNNLIPNNNLSGTSGSSGSKFNGLVADDYRISAYDFANGIATKPTSNSQGIDFSYSQYVERELVTILPDNITQGYQIGDTIIAEAEVEVLNAQNIMGLWIELYDIASSTIIYKSLSRYNSADFPTGSNTYYLKTPNATIQQGNTALSIRIRAETKMIDNVVGRANFIIKQVRCRKI